jgi:hypothetical protein
MVRWLLGNDDKPLAQHLGREAGTDTTRVDFCVFGWCWR